MELHIQVLQGRRAIWNVQSASFLITHIRTCSQEFCISLIPCTAQKELWRHPQITLLVKYATFKYNMSDF